MGQVWVKLAKRFGLIWHQCGVYRQYEFFLSQVTSCFDQVNAKYRTRNYSAFPFSRSLIKDTSTSIKRTNT